jgi:hypothetical protein
MKHVENLVLEIENIDAVAHIKHYGMKLHITSFATEFASLCKNIRETSVGESDRHIRIAQLSQDSGIDIWEINKLC